MPARLPPFDELCAEYLDHVSTCEVCGPVGVSLTAEKADPRMCATGRRMHGRVAAALDRTVGRARSPDPKA